MGIGMQQEWITLLPVMTEESVSEMVVLILCKLNLLGVCVNVKLTVHASRFLQQQTNEKKKEEKKAVHTSKIKNEHTDATHPQCFMFCGLSIRTANLIFRSSEQPLATVILWSSHCLGLLGVGCNTTWKHIMTDNNSHWHNHCTIALSRLSLKQKGTYQILRHEIHANSTFHNSRLCW